MCSYVGLICCLMDGLIDILLLHALCGEHLSGRWALVDFATIADSELLVVMALPWVISLLA